MKSCIHFFILLLILSSGVFSKSYATNCKTVTYATSKLLPSKIFQPGYYGEFPWTKAQTFDLVKYFDWKLTAQRNLQVGSLFSKRKVTGYTSYVLIGINADCDGFIYFPDKKDHQPVGRYKKNGKQWYVVASLDNNFTYNVAVNYVQGLNYALVKK